MPCSIPPIGGITKIPIQASITLPRAWGISTSLENLGTPIITYSADGSITTLVYQPCTLERLADSLVLAGLHHSEQQVTSDGRHILCVAADAEYYASAPRELVDRLARLTEQAQTVFGARHYDRLR